MLDQISENVLKKLELSGLDISDIDFEKIMDNQVGTLMRPKVNISVDTGIFKKIAMQSYNAKVIVSLILVVQNLRSEKVRKFENYQLIIGIVDILCLEKLDLDLQDPLTPIAFSNVTDETFNTAGYSLYQVDFSCSFNFTKSSVTGDYGYLKSFINKYFVNETDEFIETQIDLES